MQEAMSVFSSFMDRPYTVCETWAQAGIKYIGYLRVQAKTACLDYITKKDCTMSRLANSPLRLELSDFIKNNLVFLICCLKLHRAWDKYGLISTCY